MKVLLVGGSGLVGTLIAPYLAREHELRVLDVVPPPSGVEWHEGSILEPDDVASALDGMDAFIHLVMRSPQGSGDGPIRPDDSPSLRRADGSIAAAL